MLTKTKPHHGKVHTEFLLITPDIAQAFLDKNTTNRTITGSIVGKYARDMAAKRWRLTGEPIIFDKSGNLRNGQHRLTACVRAGVPFESMIVYGVEPEAQDVMDSGKSRSAADVLSLRGLTNTRRTVAAVRALLAHREGSAARRGVFSTAQIIATLEQHPNITKSVALVSNLPKSIPHGPLALVHYAASTFIKVPNVADSFIAVFRNGAPDYEGDPAHLLRERFIRSVGDVHRIRPDVAEWTIYYVWNLFKERETLQQLKWAKQPVAITGLKDNVL